MIDKQRLEDAKAGNVQEQVSIGKYYYFGAWGLGENIDYKKALFWLTKAAEQGHIKSQHSVGFMHYKGEGTQIDYETAFHWYTKAAEQGYTPSQNNLGCLYRDGRGVAEDVEEAFIWHSMGAEKGNASCACNLGLMYLEGNGVPESLIDAAYWINLSRGQGFEYAIELWHEHKLWKFEDELFERISRKISKYKKNLKSND